MRNILSSALLATVSLTAFSAHADDKVTLNWALWDWAATAYYQPLIDAFEAKHPNVKITYTDLGSADYSTMAMTQLAGGSGDLDIVTIKDAPGYANMVNAKTLLPLNDDIEDTGIDKAAYGGLIDELTVEDKVYALPFRSDIWITYYNKDLFDAAGVEYPTNDMTLAQFDEKARKLASGFGANKVYGALFHTWRSAVEMPCIVDGKHTLIDGSYEFLKPCYDRVLALQEEGVVPSYASLKTSNTHYSGPFYNGTVAMMPMGSWFVATQIKKVQSGESLSKNWGIAAFAHPEGVAAGSTAAVVTALSVNANSAHKKEALDFVNFVSGPEGAAVVAGTGTLPALKTDAVLSTITSTEGFPQDETSLNALKSTKAYLELPVSPKSADIEVVLNRAHDAIMTNNISVEDGLKQMDQDVQAILKK
ncbi:ABC transporter substrate-binding protein [Rhizobium halophytocola]|uniref:sn-glycerol-3-phosphate-binding periplasmic protein UgpB n=1 Tax=Rhizobium halophytocola TaxID=735519 RepID=A0ABS4E4U2_9HYPH|nr:sugar ABC transporter substrate-binding protein [Rhizobium halophytocola]MBP1852919.1 multiple sugar transport system substrate-binding protein [Rhizobium halophytocola]